MTVKELIEKLQKVKNKNQIVYVMDSSRYFTEWFDVYEEDDAVYMANEQDVY